MITSVRKLRADVEVPSFLDLRGWILDGVMDGMTADVLKCKQAWVRDGCTLLADEWNGKNNNVYVSFSVYCVDNGITFLKTVEVSLNWNDSNWEDSEASSSSSRSSNLLLLLDAFRSVIEEIGPRNVVQVVTTCDKKHYADLAEKLATDFPTIYWACSSGWVEEILHGFLQLTWISDLVEEARAFSRYVYNSPHLLNRLREATGGVDLVVVGPTPCSTDLLTVKQMLHLRHTLETMINDVQNEEEASVYVCECILSDAFWEGCQNASDLTSSLLRLSILVNDRKRKSEMGYVYASVYTAKKTINEKFSADRDTYLTIIDAIWRKLPQLPLYVAAFYLNPKFFYACPVENVKNQLRSKFFRCLEKMSLESVSLRDVASETIRYHRAQGEFGSEIGIASQSNNPGDWWSSIGWECPKLTTVATRLLYQTCTLPLSRPNTELFQTLHEPKNMAEKQRIIRMLEIQSHYGMKHVYCPEEEIQDPLAYELFDKAGEWVGGVNELSDWMPLQQATLKVDKEFGGEDVGLDEMFDDEDIFRSDAFFD